MPITIELWKIRRQQYENELAKHFNLPLKEFYELNMYNYFQFCTIFNEHIKLKNESVKQRDNNTEDL